MERVRAHERELTALRAASGSREVDGLRVFGPPDPDQRGGVVPFTIDGMHPHDVAELSTARTSASAPATTARSR